MRRLRLVLLTTVLAVAALLSTAGAVAGAGFTTFVVALEPQGANVAGSGVAVIRINPTTDEVCYVITVEGIGEPTEPPGSGLGAAHLHAVATGGIAVDLNILDTDWMRAGRDRYLVIGCTDAPSADLDAVLENPSAYFVNIHTAAFPGGAISGTLR